MNHVSFHQTEFHSFEKYNSIIRELPFEIFTLQISLSSLSFPIYLSKYIYIYTLISIAHSKDSKPGREKGRKANQFPVMDLTSKRVARGERGRGTRPIR